MAITRIQNNQITDATIVAYAKLQAGSLTGNLFAPTVTLNSNVTINGNLFLSNTGNVTTINATNTYINDPLVMFNNGYTGSLTGYDIGILVNRNLASLGSYGSVNTFLGWVEADSAFETLATTDTGTGVTSINNSGYANFKTGNATMVSGTITGTLGVTGATTFTTVTTGGLQAVAIGNATPGTGAFTTLTTSGTAIASGNLVAAATTSSTNTTTGALVVKGGAGIAGALNVGASLTVDNSTYGNVVATQFGSLYATAVSPNNYALIQAWSPATGGGIGLNAFGNIVYSAGAITFITGATVRDKDYPTGGTNGVIFAANGAIINTTGIASTSTGTGALIVTGGAGISGNIYAGGIQNTPIGSITPSTGAFTTLSTTGNLTVGGNIAITGNIVPSANVTYSLGTLNNRFKDLYLSGSTIYAGGYTISEETSGNVNITANNGNRLQVLGTAANAVQATGNIVAPYHLGSLVGATATLTTSANITGTGASTNSTSGALVVMGGAGVAGAIYAGSIQNTPIGSTTASTGAFTTGTFSSTLGVTGATTMTTATTGGLQAVAIGNATPGTGAFTTITTGGLQSVAIGNATPGTGAFTTLGASGVTSITNSTAATSVGSGALVVTGGASVGGNLYVGGNIYAQSIYGVTQDLITIQDPLVYLQALGNLGQYNYDIGFYSDYTANAYRHTGLARSYSSNVWAFFSNLASEPDVAGINWNDAGIAYDTVKMGQIIVANTTTSTNSTTGAITVAGGVGIAGALNVGGAISIGGGMQNTPVGNATPNTGAFTTLSATGASTLNTVTGASFQGIIGNATPAAGTFTTGTFNTATTGGLQAVAIGNATPGTGAFTTLTGGSFQGIIGNATPTTAFFTTANATNVYAATIGNVGTTLNGTLAATNISGTVATANVSLYQQLTNSTTNATFYLPFYDKATGNSTPFTNTSLNFRPSDGYLFATAASIATVTATTVTTSSTLLAQGNIVASSSTPSTSTTTGALIAIGGVGVAGNVNIGGLLNVAGNVAFDGGQVTHYDSIIDLHTYGNLAAWASDDGKDLGIRMHYYNGADKLAFMGVENSSKSFQFLIDATEVAGNVTGTFGNVQSGSLFVSNTTAATGATATTSGALYVAGGAGIAGNVYHGTGAVFNNTQTAGSNFQVKGATDTSLILARPNATYDAVIIGGSSAASTNGAKLQINSTDTILLPVGTNAQRPTAAGSGTDTTGMFRYSSTQGAIEWYNGTAWASASTQFTVIADQQFTGTGSQTIFTLSEAQTTNSCIVSINGVVQIPTLAYAVTSGTTLTFTEAPANGEVIDVRKLTTTTTVTGLSDTSGYVTVDVVTGTGIVLSSATASGQGSRYIIEPVNGAMVTTAANVTVASAGTSVIDNLYANTYSSAKYTITATMSGTNIREINEVLLVHNGSAASAGTVTVLSYGKINTAGNTLVTFGGTATGNIAQLQATTTNANTILRIKRDYQAL